jgi:hypothetical protein
MRERSEFTNYCTPIIRQQRTARSFTPFVVGESELTIANAEKLCEALGTELVIKKKQS